MKKLTPKETEVLLSILSYLDPEFNPDGFKDEFCVLDIVTQSGKSEPKVRRAILSLNSKGWIALACHEWYTLAFIK